MPVNAAEVRRIAALAQIELDADEVEVYRRELGSILDYMRMLEPLPVDDDARAVEATIRDLRADEVRPSLSAAEALANAPDHAAGMFRVPRMLERPDGEDVP